MSTARLTTGLAARPAQPAMLPAFAHMQRFWDPQLGSWNVKILPGEYYVTRGEEAVSTVLGSCISACVRDPLKNVGGMNHFMLPEDASTGPNNWLDPAVGLATRYGSYAMESLINDLLKLGATRERLEIKVFGGGRVLSGITDVGARNITFVRNYLQLEGYRISAEDLGGHAATQGCVFPGYRTRQGALSAPCRKPNHQPPRAVVPRQHRHGRRGRRRRRRAV